jgi:L-iditol 2-dehydrogenase
VTTPAFHREDRVARHSVLVGPATSQLEETEVGPPGPGEVLIQVIANGLCASELPTWTRGPKPLTSS